MLKIRPEDKDDYPAVFNVNLKAFNKSIEPNLVEAIRKSENYIPELSLVAILNNMVVGHILFSTIAIETDNGNIPVLSLAPLAVLPEYQNRRIGSKLIEQGLESCRRLGYKIVIVVGHPNYYPRFGFLPARSLGLEASFDVPDEAFMVLELSPGALTNIKGTVKYPPEFGV
ncbi:GCN5 family acetyltransferase [Desulforamulus aquiferis]|nr:N-acetyltransferase [Desulforamulus aquiferis]RYD05773.1 GCN5 family acetyltransferase [Desulforamulus aquiferis]